jgi:transcriptional regulator with XRE-family HTH domain
LRTISRRSGVPVRQLREEEHPGSDLSITVLLRWQRALDVPLSELLSEPEDALSLVIGQRAKLLRVMKTALSMRESARDDRTRRLSIMLCNQLQEVMPELSEQSAWPTVGSRRSHEDVGKIAENPLQIDFELS